VTFSYFIPFYADFILQSLSDDVYTPFARRFLSAPSNATGVTGVPVSPHLARGGDYLLAFLGNCWRISKSLI